MAPRKQHLSINQVDIQRDEKDDNSSSSGSAIERADLQASVLESKLRTKIDIHVLPMLLVVCTISFLDRINISNALIYGLPRDLRLTGNQVPIAISVFFVSYVAFEIPTTMLTKKTSPSIFLSSCMVVFGVLTIIQGFVQNFGGLVAIRFLLGIAESGCYPGAFYLMSMWYKRHEAQTRFTFFYAGLSIAGAFGSLIATAIGHMDGIRGYRAWRWIFILEGLLTVVLGAVGFFLISDFPEDAKWLDSDERAMVVARLNVDQGPSGVEKGFKWKDLKLLGTWRLILGVPLYFCITLPAYGLALFIPTTIAGYGYTPVQSQLHSVIPWAATLVCSLIIAYLSDRMRQRYVFVMISLVIGFAGNLMVFNIKNNTSAKVGGLSLFLMGLVSAGPIVVCWFTMNLRTHQERAVGIPWQIGLGNVSGIIAPFVYRARDAPKFTLAYSLGLGCCCLVFILSTVYYIGCRLGNRKRGTSRFDL